MLSRSEFAIEFGLKFGSDANCQLFSENGMDNLLRIVANMYSFLFEHFLILVDALASLFLFRLTKLEIAV